MKKICLPESKSKTQYFVNQAYAKYVIEAGYMPIITTPENVVDASKFCDGLLLPGGIDIDPIYYGEDNIASYSTDPDKDEFERSLLHEFVAMKKPVFGICRGFQLIIREFLMSMKEDAFNDWFTFYQNVSSHSQTNGLSLVRDIPSHFVDANVMGLYGRSGKKIRRIPVNSMHHQCLALSTQGKAPSVLKKDLDVLAWTERGFDKKDKEVMIEAFAIKTWPSRILAVQWHPEELNDTALLRGFFSPKRAKDDNEHEQKAVAGQGSAS